MVFIPILFIAIGLAMDSFSVSIAGGMKDKNPHLKSAIKVAFFFGSFQAVMPLFGWYIGVAMKNIVSTLDHWTAFGLLSFIGLKMIYESFKDAKDKKKINLLNNKNLLILSIATSIDALIIGITLGLIKVPLLISVLVIGVVTYIICLIGFLLGKRIGTLFGGRISILGGIILIVIGFKILISHLLG